MDCIFYDHNFARELKAKLRAWEAGAGRKTNNSYTLGARSTRNQVYISPDEDSDSLESEEDF
jgi:hypothetical protein